MKHSSSNIRPIGNTVRKSVKNVLVSVKKASFAKNRVLKNDKEESSKNPIIGLYRTHILFLFPRLLLYLFFTAVLFGVVFFFSTTVLQNSAILSTFSLLLLFPIVTGLIVHSVIYWVANTTVIREKNLIFHRYYGIFKQSTEVRSLAQIKSFNLVQSGVWEYLFNYGDIEVASIISGTSNNIVLQNIYPVKEAYAVISEHISRLDSQNDIVPDSEDTEIKEGDEA